ncbi:MAG: N-acetylneuraminate synthase family protein [Pseudomonadota bacterium]
MERKHHIEIIAELGINHCGDASLLRDMIHKAAECKADTVKIQLYDPKTVFGDPPIEPEKFSKLEWEAIYAARLGRRQVFWIKSECERAGIDFLASVSDLERLGWLDDVGVDRYKIASDDALNEELCKAIITKGKPIIVSDGYIYSFDFKPDYLHFKKGIDLFNKEEISWLYCISEYPVKPSKLHFFECIQTFKGINLTKREIKESKTSVEVNIGGEYEELEISPIKSIFENSYIGFSDHTIGITAAVVAMSLGARIIEKHFTLDKTLPGPDQVCSIDPEELKQLCKMRDDIEEILYKKDKESA